MKLNITFCTDDGQVIRQLDVTEKKPLTFEVLEDNIKQTEYFGKTVVDKVYSFIMKELFNVCEPRGNVGRVARQ